MRHAVGVRVVADDRARPRPARRRCPRASSRPPVGSKPWNVPGPGERAGRRQRTAQRRPRAVIERPPSAVRERPRTAPRTSAHAVGRDQSACRGGARARPAPAGDHRLDVARRDGGEVAPRDLGVAAVGPQSRHRGSLRLGHGRPAYAATPIRWQSMPESRKREVGRGERVLPGVWRLRLPLPWPGVPHCNAWAIAAGDGIVLVDTGMHEPGSLGHLERALTRSACALEHVRLLVCTHAHSDHYGQAGAGHRPRRLRAVDAPRHAHTTAQRRGPRAGAAAPPRGRAAVRRARGGCALRGVAKERSRRSRASSSPTSPSCRGSRSRPTSARGGDRDARPRAVARLPLSARAPPADLRRPPARPLSLYYDYGWTPDPAGEFLRSLDRSRRWTRRACACAGHGRPFTDVQGTSRPTGAGGAARRRDGGAIAQPPLTAFEVVPLVHGEDAITPPPGG